MIDEEKILGDALEVGIMISSRYGQEPNQPMPVSDRRTIIEFAVKITKPFQDKIDAQAERIKRLEKALTFYAEGRHFEAWDGMVLGNIQVHGKATILDSGARAQQAIQDKAEK